MHAKLSDSKVASRSRLSALTSGVDPSISLEPLETLTLSNCCSVRYSNCSLTVDLMEACLATHPPRVKRVSELLEGERDSEVVELSMLVKEEGLSEATPPTTPPGTRNFVEK